MSATAVKKIREEGTAGNDGRAEVEWFVFDADNYDDAKTALLAAADATFDGLGLHSVNIVRVAEGSDLGTIWECTVYYGRHGGTTPQEGSIYTFEVRGGTQHVKHSRKTMARYGRWESGSPGAAPNHRGAIGVKGDEIEGVDIVVPVFSWSETHYKSEAFVDAAYLAVVKAVCGSMNHALWRTYPAGEVLFMGVTGRRQQVPGAKWELTYNFAQSDNVANLNIGKEGVIPADGDLVVSAKAGWDYLWVEFGAGVDTDSVPGTPVPVQRPIYAHVERVYRQADFATLGID
jgi:hypothetical protein